MNGTLNFSHRGSNTFDFSFEISSINVSSTNNPSYESSLFLKQKHFKIEFFICIETENQLNAQIE